MKKWFSLPATAAALAAGWLGFYMSERVMHIRKKDDSLVISREVAAKRLDLKAYESLPKEEVLIPSPFGYKLKSVFVKPFPESKKWMIFCH
ncbi:MAG: alpha/beta hydrolase, partial [Bacillus sp. (in: Bacteria)]|nr:alpha/beta hydrolase [Bacillus sp. (in: firmicutes)]